MVQSKLLKPLAATFFVSGIWDLFATFVYAFLIGTVYTQPPVDRFYALFIASFLLCFAYLQVLAAFNIGRYLLVIGGVIIGRVIYVVLLFAYILGVHGFPATFWWTGVVDLLWSVLYIVLAVKCGIRIRDLFLPCREES
ncbi:MAG: hypothetical protein ACYDEZ_06940 [Methanoregula sp.]|jgi:hypothetical protein